MTSPTAQMPSTRVAIVSSTTTAPRWSTSTPISSSPNPRPDGVRPTATSSFGGGDRRAVVEVHADAAVVEALHPVDPRADSDVDAVGGEGLGDHADASGSSRARIRSSASIRVTRVPSRANACAISQPIGTAAEHDHRLGPTVEVEERLVGQRRRLSQAGDRRARSGRAPVATTNRFERIVRPSTSIAVGE